MTPEVGDLLDLVRRFLALVRDGVGSPAEDERQLALLCDRLGLAAQLLRDRAGDGGAGTVPQRDPSATRRRVAARFPRLGCYNTATRTSVEVGCGDLAVGDAVDDVTDIADELAAVEWCIRNTAEPDALWHFIDGYDRHWGAHLRRLQLYLYCLERGL